MQVIAELTNKRFFAVRAGEEPSIGGQQIEGAKESQALHESTNKGIYRDQAFGV
jgi:hypothetical protein